MSNSKKLIGGGGRAVSLKAMEPVCFAFAEVVRDTRLRQGLTMTELARRAGISRQMIGFIESRKRVPTLDLIARLCRAFKEGLVVLLGRAERLCAGL